MITATNRLLMGMAQAIEEIASRRYDDEAFNKRIARTRRLLREQQDDVAPRQEKIFADCALIDNEGNPVYEVDEDGKRVSNTPVVDPKLFDVFQQRNKDLLEETFELPFTFTLAEIRSGKERIGNNAKGFSIVKWNVEAWVLDALGPLLPEIYNDGETVQKDEEEDADSVE